MTFHTANQQSLYFHSRGILLPTNFLPQGEKEALQGMKISDQSKKISKNTLRKDKYTIIPNRIRSLLIEEVINRGKKVKVVAENLGINYSSAKSILQVYKKEGRFQKKSSKPDQQKQEQELSQPKLINLSPIPLDSPKRPPLGQFDLDSLAFKLSKTESLSTNTTNELIISCNGSSSDPAAFSQPLLQNPFADQTTFFSKLNSNRADFNIASQYRDVSNNNQSLLQVAVQNQLNYQVNLDNLTKQIMHNPLLTRALLDKVLKQGLENMPSLPSSSFQINQYNYIQNPRRPEFGNNHRIATPKEIFTIPPFNPNFHS